MTGVLTLPTVSTSTRNEPKATSTGTASMASVRLLPHKTRMIWQRPSQMWNGNSTRPTIRSSSKGKMSVTPRFGILNAARILGLVFQGNDRENRRIMSSRAAFTDHRKHDEKGGKDGAHIATRDKVSDKTLGYDCAIKAVME